VPTDTEWLARLRTSDRPRVAEHYQVMLGHTALAGIGEGLARAYTLIVTSLERGGTLYLGGNGGSFADALHISGELLKAFVGPRPIPPALAEALRSQPYGDELAAHLQRGLRAHVLGANPVLASAVANDIPVPGIGLAQELLALARPGDVFLGISTSGKAVNVRMALAVARALGLATIGLTGSARADNPLAAGVDVALVVRATETAAVQEAHIALYHGLCLMLEAHFFPTEPGAHLKEDGRRA